MRESDVEGEGFLWRRERRREVAPVWGRMRRRIEGAVPLGVEGVMAMLDGSFEELPLEGDGEVGEGDVGVQAAMLKGWLSQNLGSPLI